MLIQRECLDLDYEFIHSYISEMGPRHHGSDANGLKSFHYMVYFHVYTSARLSILQCENKGMVRKSQCDQKTWSHWIAEDITRQYSIYSDHATMLLWILTNLSPVDMPSRSNTLADLLFNIVKPIQKQCMIKLYLSCAPRIILAVEKM